MPQMDNYFSTKKPSIKFIVNEKPLKQINWLYTS